MSESVRILITCTKPRKPFDNYTLIIDHCQYGVDRSTNVEARSRATSNQARGLDSLDALDRLDDLDF